MSKTYRLWNPNQQWLLPPSVHDWLPENDLVYFILDTVNELDISAITTKYEQEERGLPQELARRQSRLKRIQEAKKALEAEAKLVSRFERFFDLLAVYVIANPKLFSSFIHTRHDSFPFTASLSRTLSISETVSVAISL